MLLGGADASGNKQKEGQRNYLSFLVGTEERINKIYKNIGIDGIHMSELSEKERQQVHNNLDLKHNDIRVWCFHVNRQKLEKYILEHPKLMYNKIPKLNVHKNFDHHLLNLFKDELESFIFPKHKDYSDLLIQTDSDMEFVVKHWRMTRIDQKDEGIAFEIADAVVWFNQKKIKVENCIEKDYRNQLKKLMEHDLLRR